VISAQNGYAEVKISLPPTKERIHLVTADRLGTKILGHSNN